MIQIF